ncbi:flagellar hook basal-body protein [Methylobacterium sp. J-076]|uniref:flagellar hook basal-body protein n=1 Tax=Methylobacterium sp. J-076 TaxID=2836655 RepID=UPI001FB971E0|nr:flagellar hook basal-body protein [Methylobacterium sp. J-076]MCJ2012037.1 flagellar hook-basal body complex protein [Methylobacterium sp. J-076]
MSLLDAVSNSTSGLSAQAFALNNISGNIANSATAGFKSTETHFADLLAETEAGSQAAGGVSLSTRSSLQLQGTVASTGVSTNLAISGEGYFIVKPNTGSANAPSFGGQTGYTRRGDFAADANGYLVNGAGYYLFAGPSASTPIQVATGSSAPTTLAVSSAGALTATHADGSTTSLGTMTLAQFDGPENLAPLDGGTYLATDRSGPPAYGFAGASVTAGAVEQSNASLSDQFAKMIETQQAYSANTKVLNAANEMLQDVITMYV